jgi:hypothetical protein
LAGTGDLRGVLLRAAHSALNAEHGLGEYRVSAHRHTPRRLHPAARQPMSVARHWL